ncbi:MAG: J domain-containing protein [Silicimonas sp.]|jgi:multidrug resistance efflux pump|nr:J domain-containing protein [Silicimonas sp.]
MTRPRSPFAILGVSPADDMTTIRIAWRAKVRALHPDRACDKVRANADLAEVNAAFDALQGHVPSLPARTAQARAAEAVVRAFRDTARRKAEAERRERLAARKAELVRKARELSEARARAAAARLRADRGTINERAALGYAAARRIVQAA